MIVSVRLAQAEDECEVVVVAVVDVVGVDAIGLGLKG